jgi:dihydrolipoamide dehydrogenase
MEKYDLGIVGGGPAGYTAALHATTSGKKVILFEKENIGGVCLNKGCIPTKSILHASELFYKLSNCQNCGISADNIQLDYSAVVSRKNSTVEKLRKGIELALKNAKVTTIKAEAQILNSNEILANGEKYTCDKIVCATGSYPREIKGLEFDHKFILSSDDVLELKALPESILIIGSGAIGIEWARIFSNFGVETTIVELAPHLLPLADIEVSKRIERIFKSKKLKFFTQTSVTKIEQNSVTLSNGEELKPTVVLVATGRIPNISEKIEGVEYIGDSAGEIQLAHFAIKQAIEKTQNITFKKDLVPSVVYGSPEIAWVGKREQDLEGENFKKSLTLVSSLGKAHCDDETEGFIKLIEQSGKIVGAHIVCAEASSLLQQILIAIQFGIDVEELKEVCFPHPTYSEGIFDSLFKL